MKILHVNHLYHPSIGGSQLHTQMMAEKLIQFGEKATVFTARTTQTEDFLNLNPALCALTQQELINGVELRRFNINDRFMSLVLQKKIKIPGTYRLFKALTGETFGFWENGPVTLKMLLAIWQLKPDIILAINNYYFTTYLCYLAKKLFSFPLVLMPITHWSNPWTHHLFLKVMYKACDRIIACTEFEKKYLIHQGHEAKKIKVIPLGISPQVFDGADKERARQKYNLGANPLVAYFGRKVHQKGIETLIDCMGLVWQKCPEARLLLAGYPEENFMPVIKKHLAQYAAPEQNKILSIDNFKESEKKDIYAAIDMMAMPSNVDCFGITYLEAWVSAKPVIACRDTPQETIIREGIDGLLVEYGNKEELAAAILKLFQDSELAKKMGENGKEMVRTRLNLDAYTQQLRDEYYQLLKKE